jgi:splicing factor 3B subunit 3
LEGRHPITDMKIIDPASIPPSSNPNTQYLINESSPIIYTLTGTGRRSMLRYMMHGLSVNELAMTELHAHATNIFAVKGLPENQSSDHPSSDQLNDRKQQYHSYICLSFASSTVVLSVGETVTEVNDSGLLTTVSSIFKRYSSCST